MASPVRIFLDTEFTDFHDISLISIGMVTEFGEEFYLENLQYDKKAASTFVKEHVLPLCEFDKFGVSYKEIGLRAYEWFTNLPYNHLIIVADYHTDIDLLAELMYGSHPKIISCRNLFLDLQQVAEFKNEVYQRAKREYDIAKSRYFNLHHARRHQALVDARGNAFAFKYAVENMHLKYPENLLDDREVSDV